MGASERSYDQSKVCPQCKAREGKGPGDRIPGSIRRGPDDGRLLCGPCWADTLPSGQAKERR